MPPIQYVTLVASRGTPVRLANQTGAPYPTTGSGALVFADSPELDNPTINGATWTGPQTVDDDFTVEGDLTVETDVNIGGALVRTIPVTKTADFTLAATENWVINNKSGSACTVTLPAASSCPGREVMFKTTQAQALSSASANVVPLIGGSAGTAILTGTAGRWAALVSDGTNWVIMAGVV